MKDENLSKRVKEMRNQQGMTQEVLSEKSGLSLRTVQRIENNETVPRGDSLKRLAIALNTSPDDMIDWKIQEDKGYLTLMSFSAIGFLLFPILGIILPLIFWILKRDKVKHVNELGKSILNFEITWTILFFLYIISLVSGMWSGIIHRVSPMNIMFLYIPVALLYLYNIVVILLNTIRISQSKKAKFIPALKMFK
ncbi:helix-turn-helix domain-containing protein [Zobellia amurskyensis]|uniref:Helix-turn-helix domain-containing protein n=1 Tax=Zobellia amurskyensis TaxID=248905 RepID=A0A7X3D0L6_9FLAO|nr:helix-turn-helix domain-containing protein [Zobellia amurskyensis]MUH34760.1 helix-turn-helix domain-containing protein [Zobellia amurskyensis]